MAGVVEERNYWYCRVVVTTSLTEDLSATDDTLIGSRVSDDLLWDCVTEPSVSYLLSREVPCACGVGSWRP